MPRAFVVPKLYTVGLITIEAVLNRASAMRIIVHQKHVHRFAYIRPATELPSVIRTVRVVSEPLNVSVMTHLPETVLNKSVTERSMVNRSLRAPFFMKKYKKLDKTMNV